VLETRLCGNGVPDCCNQHCPITFGVFQSEKSIGGDLAETRIDWQREQQYVDFTRQPRPIPEQMARV